MSRIRTKYDDNYKKNAVALSFASEKTVKEVSDELGINDGLLYRWRKKYTPDGDKTKYATQDEEMKKLRLELAETKMECDMLKKATAYFANLKK